MAKQSKKGELNKEDLMKIGKGAVIAGVGAALVFIAEALPSVNFGEYQPVAIVVSSVLVNVARKLAKA